MEAIGDALLYGAGILIGIVLVIMFLEWLVRGFLSLFR